MSGPVRVLFNVIPGYSCNIIIFLLYTSALFIWISQVKCRLLQNEECKFLSGVAALMLFLMAVRTIKFDFLPSGSVYARYAWYLYYVPQTLAVLWMFFAVLYIGKPYHYQLERKWRILYIPAFILIGGIMTNDFHQLAFRFPDGIQNWGMEYIRGFLYILAIGWIMIFCAMILVITFSRCAFSQNRRKIWIPMIPLGIGGVYTIIYILSPKGLFPSLYKMAEVICFIFPAFMECLILARLLPSNDSYMDLWQVSSAGGGLMDFEGNIFYSSEKCLPVKKEQIITAKNDSNTISLEIGSNEMTVNDEKVSLDTAPVIIDDRTLVPLRAVSEALDCNVDWDGDTKTVAIAPHKYNEYYTQKLMENLPKDENYVISPFSLEMAMMMASEGAVGDTKQEITKVFNSPNTSLYSQIITDNKNKGVDIANSIWFNKDSGKNAYFADDYQKKIQSDYQGTAQSVTNDDSIEKVNEWIEKQTNGKITNMLSEENRGYVCALVNAIYMKADWVNKFEKEGTYKETFTDINGNKSEIDFMHRLMDIEYYENGDTKAVKLPYTNGLSMVVVLGDTKNILNDIHNNKMTSKLVDVSLPKFKGEYSIDYVNILKNMGIEKVFDYQNADFSLMLKNYPERMIIEAILQKAMIDVDEKGTEAAAATVIITKISGYRSEEPIEFKADKPFTYYILDDSGNIYFAGRYVKAE